MDCVNDVRSAAAAVRRRLGASSGLDVSLRWFPAASCDTASLVLDRYLEHEAGLGAWIHVTGTDEEGDTHVWLEQHGLIVDITADQFDDVDDPVIVTLDRSWHDRRFPDQHRRPTSDASLAATSARLGHVHRAVAQPG